VLQLMSHERPLQIATPLPEVGFEHFKHSGPHASSEMLSLHVPLQSFVPNGQVHRPELQDFPPVQR
jgi:hypothetical protein